MTPREAAIAVAENLEKTLKEKTKYHEGQVCYYSVQFTLKSTEGSDVRAKEHQAAATYYEDACKELDKSLREVLVTISKEASNG